jgi:NAD(P)-dependent dehydrogenase (short-subunit alcohol dehydrogenase family)
MALKAFDLTGKVALVTGGNGGIGLGMAEGLAQAGADIVIWGTNDAKNTAAAERLKPTGVRVETRKVDVSDEQQVVRGMAETVAAMGRIDTVIANAGVVGGGAFADMTSETWRRVMGVNLDGVFFTLREACKHMLERSKAGDAGGSLIVTSSMVAYQGAARNEAYGASKNGVIGLVQGVAVEYARHGVRCNAIMPGWVESEMTGPRVEDEKFNTNVIGRVPSRRWGQPEEFAGIAVYLASDASSFHTGDSILIDGGYAIF